MKWETCTFAEINAFDRNTPIILNLAAIEQHGPHLPLNTDAVIGQHFLDQLDARFPQGQLTLPQISVCCSAHHLDFTGTLSVPHQVLMDYVCAILDSVRHSGFRKIVILNSHGGNQAIGQVIIEHYGALHPDCLIALTTWWTLVRDDLQRITETGPLGTGHACEFETSLLMAIGTISVSTKLPEGEHHTALFEWSESSMLQNACVSIYRSMKEISGNSGIAGQPDAGSAAKGDRIIELVVTRLARVLTDIANKPLP